MVIPINSALYQNDGRSFQEKMIEYIKEHWGDFLGDDIKLLNLPNGLDLLSEKYNSHFSSIRQVS